MSRCAMVRRHVGAYLDGELEPASQLDFEEHLDGCAECQERLAFEVAFRDRVVEALGDVPSLLASTWTRPRPRAKAPRPGR